jgi:hypothetical protein
MQITPHTDVRYRSGPYDQQDKRSSGEQEASETRPAAHTVEPYKPTSQLMHYNV